MTVTHTVNDDFLRAGRERPRPEFAAALYRCLAQPQPERKERRAWLMSLSRWLAPQRLALSLAAIVAALGLFLAASPVARAQLAGVLRVVGGVPFNEVEPQPGEAGSGDEASTVPSQTLSLAEAQASLPFALAVPAWTPGGYTLQDEVVVTSFAEGTLTFARVVWYSEMGQVIDLRAEYPGGVTWEVGPDSLEEVTVNGASAAVLHGMWNADTNEWVRSSAITLSWRRGDVTYHLSSSDGSTSAQVLIQMAESIP